MMITVEIIKGLSPCYSTENIRGLLGDGVRPQAAMGLLLGLPVSDARWVLAWMLPPSKRVAWAMACAERARRYAASTYASTYAAANASAYASASTYAANVAANTAAYNAANAANAAASAAARAANAAFAAANAANADAYAEEHKLACVLGLELLVAP